MATASGARRSADNADRGLVDAARGVGLEAVLEPIVTLPDGAVVGFESLARWPSMYRVRPVDVFSFASTAGRLNTLDRMCRDTAINTALGLRLPRGTMLAINTEPVSTYAGCDHDGVLARGRDELAIMFELTERNLLAHPHALLAKVAAMRYDGFSTAFDDVGAHRDSLTLLGVLMPDVIKLDLRLVQAQPDRHQAQTLAAVMAHHQRTGAVILAEGIENDDHLEQALALGATLGQGRKYAEACPANPRPSWRPPTRVAPPQPMSTSPFDLLSSSAPLRTARKRTLTAFSQHIEAQAGHSADPPMLLTALQHAQHFTTLTRRRYLDLAQSLPLVALFGQHMPCDLGPGIRGVSLSPTDPLCNEWTVLALGPQIAVALIARECDDQRNHYRPDSDRLFDFVITYDRSLVTAAARNLLDRLR